MSEQKRLLRAREGRWAGGVCMGLAHYLAIDVVFVRLAFVLLGLNGIGVAVYIILWILIPDDAAGELASGSQVHANLEDIGQRARSFGESIGSERGAMIAGLLLVVIGALLLSHQFLPWIGLSLLWPLLLIGLGGFILVRGR